MTELKTKVNDASVKDFINTVKDEQMKKDSLELLKIFESITKVKAKMWGSSIIGFGQYHYKSERSRQEGDWPLTGFSPRKDNLTLYVMPSFGVLDDLLKKLGKNKTSVGCLYVKRLSDINIDVLKEIIKVSFEEAKRRFNNS
ncbi:DUF1801 domain-containing protein [Candidatus Dojkabacteria bacterium]|nr:DUF1801 domain-containing protein [Candidatus Dojkabacteria bacterium]